MYLRGQLDPVVFLDPREVERGGEDRAVACLVGLDEAQNLRQLVGVGWRRVTTSGAGVLTALSGSSCLSGCARSRCIPR